MKKYKCDVCGKEFEEIDVMIECSDCYLRGWKKEFKMTKKRKYTGIKDINGKMIFEGNIVMGDSKVYWNKERAMWGISNGKDPLGDYKYREDFIKVEKKKLIFDRWKTKKIIKPNKVKFNFVKKE